MERCPKCKKLVDPTDHFTLARSRPISQIECDCGYYGLPIQLEMPKLTKTKLFLESEYGKVCCSYNSVEDSNSVVILGHGYASSKESRTNKALEERLNLSKISTISYDVYGHGESKGKLEDLTITKAVNSLLAAYQFAKNKDYKNIGLSGSSFTGIVSLIASTKARFSVLALKCPVFDSKKLWDSRLSADEIEQWKTDGHIVRFKNKMSFELYKDASQYDMNKVAASISIPTLVVHGDSDNTVPLSQAKELVDNLSGEKKLIIIKEADHFFKNQENFEEMVDHITEWFVSHMQA